MSRTIADLIQDRFGLPTEAGRARPAEGPLALLLSHRTQRRYTPDPVPDDVLEMALAAALSAPSKSDLQQVGKIGRAHLNSSHSSPSRMPSSA